MKKAISYVNLKALLGGLLGAVQSTVTESQNSFDGWVRFVRRNKNIFTVAMFDGLSLTFDYDESNDVFALGVLDGSSYIDDGYCFPSNEDISDFTADAVKVAWRKAVDSRMVVA